jgi:hypothetical protein
MEKLNFEKKNLRKFAITMAAAFLLVAFLLLFRHKPGLLAAVSLSLLFSGLGFICPASLKLAYLLWMKLAFILGWVNTRLILIIIFYLIFSPLAVILKILRKDFLDQKIEKERPSYWLKKVPSVFNAKDYERQF